MRKTPWLAGKVLILLGLAALATTACTSGSNGQQSATDPTPQQLGDLAGQLEGNPLWQEIHQDQLALRAEQFEQDHGIAPPDDADFVRFIETAEFGRVQAECVSEQGFEATVTPDGGVAYGSVPQEQQLAFDEALYRCRVAYPLHPRILAPRTDEQIQIIYDYYRDTLMPCLAADGYQVGEPPSWETFLADFRAEDRHPWSPYDSVDIDRMPDAAWQQLNSTCPQEPPSELLFGTGGGQ